jgi:hypothetical protein
MNITSEEIHAIKTRLKEDEESLVVKLSKVLQDYADENPLIELSVNAYSVVENHTNGGKEVVAIRCNVDLNF